MTELRAKVLNEQFLLLVKQERKITFHVLQMIAELSASMAYAQLGFSSMFEYLTKGAGYSESAAYRRISSSKLLKSNPEISEKIQSGQMNLTQASLLQTALKQEQKASGRKVSREIATDLASNISGKSSFETKALLMQTLTAYEPRSTQINPTRNATKLSIDAGIDNDSQSNRSQSAYDISDSSADSGLAHKNSAEKSNGDLNVKVSLQFSQDEWKIIQDALAISSHVVPSKDIKDLLLHFSLKIKTNREVKSKPSDSKNNIPRKTTATQGFAVTEVQPAPARAYISISTRRQLFKRAQFQCQYQVKMSSQAVRCSSKSFLEIEHIQPIALGGKNDLKNLRVYCRNHNHLAAIKSGISLY